MKKLRGKALRLIVLLVVLSFGLLKASQEPQKKRKLQPSQSIQFFPFIYDRSPEFPSPYTMDDGTEILVVITDENKYALVPVTVEKGEPLGYRESDWEKIKFLEVDAEDFPTLARTGLHSEIELDFTKRITGRSVAEITENGRPEGSSGAGFMSREEDIISVLRGDNRLVKKMGLTHPQLARTLFHVFNLIRWVSYKSPRGGRTIPSVEYFFYNGRKIHLLEAGGRGWQYSIFDDEVQGMYHIEFSIDLDEEEKSFLKGKYPGLIEEEMAKLLDRLSHVHTGEMVPFYAMRYGFYEGHTDYRADPLALSLIFGLKSLKEIENLFPGNLDKTLFGVFSKEGLSAKEGGCHE